MPHTDKHTVRTKRRFRIGKILLRVFLSCLLLIIVTLGLTQTRLFKDWLKDYIVETANESINGHLAIGRLDGNLYSSLALHDVNVRLDTDTVLFVSEIRLRYAIIPIFDDIIQIDSLQIDSLDVNIAQLSDSSWNVMHVYDQSPETATAPETTAKSTYTVTLNDFSLKRGRINISAENAFIPKTVDDIALRMAGQVSSDHQVVQLHNLSFRTKEPSLVLSHFSLEATADSEKVVLRDIDLRTALNRIIGEAEIYPNQPFRTNAKISADSLHIAEFKEFLPPSLAGHDPDLSFSAILAYDTLAFTAHADESPQRLNIATTAWPISVLIDSISTIPLSYAGKINVERFDPAAWMDSINVRMALNGSVDFAGSGISPETIDITTKVDLTDSKIDNYVFSELQGNLAFAHDQLSSSIRVSSDGGRVAGNVKIGDIFASRAFDVSLNASDFNPAVFGLPDSLPSILTFRVDASGMAPNPDRIEGRAALELSPSRVMDVPVDTAVFTVAFSPDDIAIDSGFILARGFNGRVSGNLSTKHASDLDFIVNFDDLSPLAEVARAEILNGRGSISGSVTGTPDDLQSTAHFSLTELAYNNLSSDKLTGDLKAIYRDSALAATIDLKGTDFGSDGYNVDTVGVTADYDGDSIRVYALAVYGSEIRAECDATIRPDSTTEMTVHGLTLHMAENSWRGGSDSTVITVGEDYYTIDNLFLEPDSAAADSTYDLSVNGAVSLSRDAELTVAINNLAIRPLAEMATLDLGGILSASATITSPLDTLRLRGTYAITAGQLNDLRFQSLRGDFAIKDSTGSATLVFKPTVAESLTVDAALAIPSVSTDSLLSGMENYPLDLHILSDSLSLSVMKAAGYMVKAVDGYLNCDIRVSRTMDDPDIAGEIGIRGGALNMPAYGIDYSDIEADVSFLPNRIILDSLVILQKRGRLHLDGQIAYDSSIISGQINSSQFELMTKDFYAVQHKYYEIQLTSDVALKGTGNDQSYSGSIIINRSRIYLPAVMKQAESDALETAALPRLLVATARDSIMAADSLSRIKTARIKADSTERRFMDDLHGSLKLTIPKNTWIKSPDLNIELAGDLDIVKNGPDFELFGDIRVVRGDYNLYGKRFTIKQGELLFSGGATYNPNLNIEAEYQFRTQSREKKTLNLAIGGTAEIPVLHFTLDGSDISEGNAVAYILFGRSLDELSQNQRNAMAGNGDVGTMASGAAAQLLAGQLSQALGSKLGLDVIDVTAQDDWRGAAVVIGKYLTPDLFMSYQRSFGSALNNDPEPELVTLEYQLTKIIYLQLTEGDAKESGFDVIFKLHRE